MLMKKISDLKIYVKLSMIIGWVILIGLAVILVSVNYRTRAIMTNQMNARLNEITEARATVTEEYFSKTLEYYKSIAALPSMSDAILYPDDAEIQARAQSELTKYASTSTDLESLYLADPDTYVYAHTDTSFIGQYASPELAIIYYYRS